MKRRKFLLTSGTAVLGSTAVQSVTQEPSLGLNFDLVGVENVQPSNTDTILVDFENFELVPKYIDEKSENATITITLDIEGEETVQTQADISLINGKTFNRSDLGSALPIVQDEIDSNQSSLNGNLKIEIDHSSVSDLYKKSFTITDNPLLDQISSFWSLNEWTGEPNDLIRGKTATVNGPERGSFGIAGTNAYNFTKPNQDYLDMGNIHNFSDKFTIGAWVRLNRNPDDKQSYHGIADKREGSSPYSGYSFFVNSLRNSDKVGQPSIWVRDQNNNQFTATADDNYRIDDQEWHHLAFSVDLNDTQGLKIYVDGNEVTYDGQDDPTSCGDIQNNVSFQVGTVQRGDQGWTDGSICNLRVYSRVLSDTEVSDMYSIVFDGNTNSNLHNGSEYSPLSRWQFESSNDQTTAIDSWSGNDLPLDGNTYETNAVNGNSLGFDGTNSIKTNVTDKPSNASLTISIWAYFVDNPDSYRDLLSLRDSTDSSRTIIISKQRSGFNNGRIKLQTSEDGRISGSKSGNWLANSGWNHFVATFDKSSNIAKFYHNGKVDFTMNIPNTTLDTSGDIEITLGTRTDDRGPHNGYIDDVRIYDETLDADKVNQLYRWGTDGADYRSRIVSYKSRLQSWWELNETGGSTAYDSSENNNDATVNGTSTISGIINDSAYDFNGSSDYINSNSTVPHGFNKVSVSAWIYPRQNGNVIYGMFNSGTNRFQFYTSNDNHLRFNVTDGNAKLIANNDGIDIKTGEWSHVAAVYDGSKIIRYINGVESGTRLSGSLGSLNCDANNHGIGAQNSSGSFDNNWDGYISNIRIYDRPLAPQEVSYIYEQRF